MSAESTLVYQPVFVRGLCVVTWGLLATGAALVAIDDAGTLWRWLPPLALVALVVHLLFWRPAVVVDDHAVTLRNLVRDVRVPWQELDAVDTRYALALFVGDRKFTAWAAPAPGRLAAVRLARRDAQGIGVLGADLSQGVSSSATPGSDSGAAALMVRLRWEQRRALPADPDDPVRVTWSVPLLVALAVLVALSVLVLAL